MGNRLHVCKKYDVEFANISDFNWKTQGVENLFAYFSDYYTDINANIFDYAENDFWNMVKTFKDYAVLESEKVKKDLKKLSEDVGYDDPTELGEVLEEFYKAADTSDGFIHFSMF